MITLANHLRCAGPCAVFDFRSFSGIVAGLAFRLDEGPAVVSAGGGVSRCTFTLSGAPSAAETAAVRFVNAKNGGGIITSSFSFGVGVEVVDSSNILFQSDTFDGCVTVTKAETYWARITNGCGFLDSRAATVVPARRRAVRP